MKSLQAQDGNTQQMLPEVQREGWPSGLDAGNGCPWEPPAGTRSPA